MLPVKSRILPTVSRFFDDDWNNLFEWRNDHFVSNNLSMPAVNIHENEDQYMVEMAAPGLERDHFKIELDKNRLTISYQSENTETEERDEKFIRKEYNYSGFSRSFHLNKNVVDEEKIEAKYENGVLHLVIPKKEEAKEKPARLIEIS